MSNNETFEGYRSTIYRVLRSPPVELRVDVHSQQLALLQNNLSKSSSGFITGHNPYSNVLTNEENEKWHMNLTIAVETGGWPFLEGEGIDPLGKWPSERSILVLGISLAAACKLAFEFEQNAIIWSGGNAVPRLIDTSTNCSVAIQNIEALDADPKRRRLICPNPNKWHQVHQVLTRQIQTNEYEKTAPPIPLILSGWNFSSDHEKAERWLETVEWCVEHDAMDALGSLTFSDYYFSRPSLNGVQITIESDISDVD